MNCETCGKPTRSAVSEDVPKHPDLVGQPIHEDGYFSCHWRSGVIGAMAKVSDDISGLAECDVSSRL